MAVNESARAEAFAAQADRSREMAAGYARQMIELSRLVRDLRDNTVQAINTMQIPHRWTDTRLDLMIDGQWVAGPDLKGADGLGIRNVAIVGDRLVLTYDNDYEVDLGDVSGDMHASAYDEGGRKLNVYAMGNMVEGEDAKIMTAAEREAIAANTDARHSHSNKSVLDGTEESFTSALKSKLDGITAGATANDTDAHLLSRANHTGTQPAESIDGLASVATSGNYNDLSGRPPLGSASAESASAFATAAQGAKADGALQPSAIGVSVQPYDGATAMTNVAQNFSKPQRTAPVALASAAAINMLLGDGNDRTLTLAHNATIANPADIAVYVGQKGTIAGQQDGAGGRTLAMGNLWFPVGAASMPPVPATANGKFRLDYHVVSSTRIDFTVAAVNA